MSNTLMQYTLWNMVGVGYIDAEMIRQKQTLPLFQIKMTSIQTTPVYFWKEIEIRVMINMENYKKK